VENRLVLFEGGRLRVLALLAVAALLFAAQNVLIHRTPLVLDAAALVVVYLALESAVTSGAVLALLVGYLGDVFSGESRGLVSASLVLVFLLIRLSVVRLTGSRWIPITALSVVATLLALFIRFLIEALVGPDRSTFSAISPSLGSLVIGAVLFGYPCYRLLRFVDDRFRTREDDATIRSIIPRRPW
jgi:rod shape-determining protein MreD